MFLSRRSYLTAFSIVVLMSPCSQAGPGTETYTVSTPSNMMTDFTHALTVPAFDTTKGMLESVVISFTDNADLLGTLKNRSASTRNFNISEDVKFSATFNGSTVLSDELAPAAQSYSLASGDTGYFGEFKMSGGTKPLTIIDPTLLAQYSGTTPLTFTMSTMSEVFTTGQGGNILTSFRTTADASLTVTYNYIINNGVTPEPASLVMTLLGGVMVATAGYARNRARSKSVA